MDTNINLSDKMEKKVEIPEKQNTYYEFEKLLHAIDIGSSSDDDKNFELFKNLVEEKGLPLSIENFEKACFYKNIKVISFFFGK
jgi:hypothetical protein